MHKWRRDKRRQMNPEMLEHLVPEARLEAGTAQ
jgi:hypothetical protein